MAGRTVRARRRVWDAQRRLCPPADTAGADTAPISQIDKELGKVVTKVTAFVLALMLALMLACKLFNSPQNQQNRLC